MNTHKKAKIIYEFDVLKFYCNMYRVGFFLLTSEFCIVYIFEFKFFNNSVIQDNILNISPISIFLFVIFMGFVLPMCWYLCMFSLSINFHLFIPS